MILKVIVYITLSLFLLGEKAYSSELRFGFTGPLTGPNERLGQQAVRGIQLGFQRINASNQLNYRLSLFPLDDGYEPERTVPQVIELINNIGVKAMIGSVGTPTNLASLGILSKHGIPLIAPLSGAQSLRADRSTPFIFNTRAGYAEEAHHLVNTLINNFDIKPNEIAIVAQKDSFGDSGLASTLKVLTNAGLKDPSSILQIRYLRNNSNVDNIVADILGVYPIPKAIVMASTYEITTNLIKQLEQFGIYPIYASFSFSGLKNLQADLSDTKASVIISQTTPPFSQTESMLVQQLKTDMERFGDTDHPTTIQFESYINTLIVGQALLALKEVPTSNEIEDSLKKLTVDNREYQGESALQFLNPKNRHIWVSLIRNNVIQELTITDIH